MPSATPYSFRLKQLWLLFVLLAGCAIDPVALDRINRNLAYQRQLNEERMWRAEQLNQMQQLNRNLNAMRLDAEYP